MVSVPATPVMPSAEFYFEHAGVDYVVYPAGWVENGCDVFDISLRSNDEFVDTVYISPLDEVADVFAAWAAKKK